jgi:hypothetical protein
VWWGTCKLHTELCPSARPFYHRLGLGQQARVAACSEEACKRMASGIGSWSDENGNAKHPKNKWKKTDDPEKKHKKFAEHCINIRKMTDYVDSRI